MNKLLQHIINAGDVDHKILPSLLKMDEGGELIKLKDSKGRVRKYNTESRKYKRLYDQGKIGSWSKFDQGSGKWVSSDASDPNAEFVSSPKVLPEVTVTAKVKPNTLGSYSSSFYKENPYEDFYRNRYQQEKENFESAPGWAQQSVGGWDRDSRQKNVRDQINQEYQQQYVDYISQMLQKRTPQGNRRRDEWLSTNNFTDKELGFLTGSTNLPQPSLWAQGLQGAYNVADMVSFGQLPEINMPGIAKSEVSQYNNPLLALAPLSVPAKIVQSTYKDNYSVGDALAGRPNNASITEDIITDPLTWATFGAKGALTAAPRFGNMISNLNRVGRVVPRLSGAADDVSKTVGSFQKFKDGLRQLRENYVDFSGEIEGTFTKGRQAAIDEGNQWFAKWANDPATQAKINESLGDMRSSFQRYIDQTPEYKKDVIKGLEDNRARLENNFQHTLNYVPDSKEYPLWKQFVDFLGDQKSVHRGNWGVSYGHDFEPWQMLQQGYTPKQVRAFQSANPRQGGAWISRNRNLSNRGRTSTTVHENTHQWVKDYLLNKSGQSREALAALTPEKRQLYEQWSALRNQGKTTKEIEEIMGKENATYGYLSDPTEVHARIMELRKHFGLKPGEMITPEKANQMMGSVFFGDTPVTKKFGDIFQDEGSFANMFNKLWGVAPVAVGAGTLMNEKKQGGPIVSQYGQWAYPGQRTIVPTPTGKITMKGVPYPVYGEDETGYGQMMMPGGEYQFPGQMVYEKPMMESGGQHGGLDRWFAEKWVDVKTGKACGRQEGEKRRSYPACRPSRRVNEDTPKTSGELSSSEREKFKRSKTSSERINYQHRRKEYGGETNEQDMANKPNNPSLWSKAKSLAKQKFDVYPSAYANGWAAKWYKSKGGTWRKAEYGMEIPYMEDGGIPDNEGFRALPPKVQQQIIDGMAFGGYIPEMGYGGAAQQAAIAIAMKKAGKKPKMPFGGLLLPGVKKRIEEAKPMLMQMAPMLMGAPPIPMMAKGGDPDGEMALGQIDAAIMKLEQLRKFIQPDSDLEPWVNSKLTLMDDYASAVSDYMMFNPENQEQMPEMGRGGYTVTRSNDRKGKTHKVTGPDGTVKYFGDSKLGQHPKDPERKKAFYARHKKNLDANPYFRAFARATWKDGGELPLMKSGGECPPGMVFSPIVNDCVPIEDSGFLEQQPAFNQRGTSTAGINLSYPKFNSYYNISQNPFGRATHELGFGLPQIARGRGSVDISGMYTPKQNWSANLSSRFDVGRKPEGRRPTLTLDATVDQYFNDPELQGMNKLERLMVPSSNAVNYNIKGGVSIPLKKQGTLKISGSYGKQSFKKGGSTFSGNAFYEMGGPAVGDEMEVTPEQLQMLKDGGYTFEII